MIVPWVQFHFMYTNEGAVFGRNGQKKFITSLSDSDKRDCK